MRYHTVLIVVAVVLPFVSEWCAIAGDVAIPPSADTCLLELDPEFNLGGQRDLPAGTLGSMAETKRCRALYAFDVNGAVPEGAEITAARLRIEVTKTPEAGKRNSIFSLHRVLVSWGEGGKRGDNPGGAEAEPGESTWRARFHPDQLWSVPGGTFGADFSTERDAERAIIGDGGYVFEMNQSGLETLRQWHADPDLNFGWLLATQAEDKPKTARRWASREHRNHATGAGDRILGSTRGRNFTGVESQLDFRSAPGLVSRGAWNSLSIGTQQGLDHLVRGGRADFGTERSIP